MGIECYGNTEEKITNCSWSENWNNRRRLGKTSQEYDLSLALKSKRQFNRHFHHRKLHVYSLFDALLEESICLIFLGRLCWCSIITKVKDFSAFSSSAFYLHSLLFVQPEISAARNHLGFFSHFKSFVFFTLWKSCLIYFKKGNKSTF